MQPECWNSDLLSQFQTVIWAWHVQIWSDLWHICTHDEAGNFPGCDVNLDSALVRCVGGLLSCCGLIVV